MFLAWLLAVLFAASPQGDLQQTGLKALDGQNYAQAEQIFGKLAQADPKDYAAVFYLALAETGLNKDSDAAAHYKQVLALKPGLYEAELNLGILDLRDHQPTGAVPLLQDAAKQKPTNARVQRYLGDALLGTGDLADAATAYQTALTADPKLAAAELGLGQALLQQNKLADALPHYQQAATLDPNLKSYLLEIAQALSHNGRGEDAIPILKQFSSDPGAREELGRIYLDSKRPADAVSEFQAACEISRTPANELALATAYLANNQPDQAAPILERALAENPNDYDLHMAVGRIDRDRHQNAQAAEQFLAAARLRPDSIQAWNEAVNPLVMVEQYSQALAVLDKIRSLNSENSGDLYYRAMIFDKLHQIKPALEAYQKFLAMSQGQHPDQEFVARQRSRILEREANR